MDRRISLFDKNPLRSDSGAEKRSEVLVTSAWAYMQEVSGSEDTDGKIKHLVNRTYTIRFNAIVKEKSNSLVLMDDSMRYEVIHVIEIGRREHLEIRVKAYE